MLSTTPLHLLIDRSTLEPWRKSLLDGADRVEERGLAKGIMCNDSGAVCARGALINSRPDHTDGWYRAYTDVALKADRRLACWIVQGIGVPVVDTVPLWNNAPDRTQAEVVNTMRACALDGVVP